MWRGASELDSFRGSHRASVSSTLLILAYRSRKLEQRLLADTLIGEEECGLTSELIKFTPYVGLAITDDPGNVNCACTVYDYMNVEYDLRCEFTDNTCTALRLNCTMHLVLRPYCHLALAFKHVLHYALVFSSGFHTLQHVLEKNDLRSTCHMYKKLDCQMGRQIFMSGFEEFSCKPGAKQTHQHWHMKIPRKKRRHLNITLNILHHKEIEYHNIFDRINFYVRVPFLFVRWSISVGGMRA
jgi:hypothetical protein